MNVQTQQRIVIDFTVYLMEMVGACWMVSEDGLLKMLQQGTVMEKCANSTFNGKKLYYQFNGFSGLVCIRDTSRLS